MQKMMTSEEAVYFVYVVENGRAVPAKWYSAKINSTTGKARQPDQKHLLKWDEHNLTLNELCAKYPFKGTIEHA